MKAFASRVMKALGEISKIVECQILLFPILVVLLGCVTFLFGGCCAAWQWWTAVAVVMAIPFAIDRQFGWRKAMKADIVFLLGLAVLWMVTIFSFDTTTVDNFGYHLPATRMLIEGWNPISQATGEAIAAGLQIEPWDMRLYHVLFTAKSVWVFNAVAWHFHHDPFAVLCPASLCVAAGGYLVLWKILSQWSVSLRVMFLCLLWVALPPLGWTTDFVVAVSGIGLLLTMRENWQKGRLSIFRLLCFSFWMMNAKSPGLLACFAFWLVFGLVWLVRTRGRSIGSLVGIGGTLTLLFVLVSVSPYYTAWRDFGHPLYPFQTSNPEKYPVRDITPEFLATNDDCDQMGRIGNFCNAYISPSLTQAYYRWALDRPEFHPVREVWRDNATPDGRYTETSGTSWLQRLGLMLMLGVLLANPGSRLIGGLAVVALFIFPVQYMGYWRYTPWLDAVKPFALCVFLSVVLSRVRVWMRIEHILATATVLLCCAWWWFLLAYQMDGKQQAAQLRPKILYAFNSGDVSSGGRLEWNAGGRLDRAAINNLKLLQRHWRNFRGAEIRPLPVEKASKFTIMRFGAWLPKNVLPPPTPYEKLTSIPDRRQRLMSYPAFVLLAPFRSAVTLLRLRLHI